MKKRFNTRIIGCKTIRNRNKLALSSRIFLFTKKELSQVEKISNKFLELKIKIKKIRKINKFLLKSKKEIENFFNIKIEYLENRSIKNLSKSNKYKDSRIFLAYYFKDIRLIDNF